MMPGDPRLRASDADRERAVQLLREHHAVGRLTAEEFESRLDKVLNARTLGELDATLADMPAIDLYQLPSAGIRPAQRAVRVRDGQAAGLDRRGDGGLLPQRAEAWGTWATASTLLVAIWLTAAIVTGGVAWIPWFLLIVIPWGLAIARRPRS